MLLLDLFAGAGGLSEGFWKEDFSFVSHIEMDKYACQTLKTRAIYYYLKKKKKLSEYKKYIQEISKEKNLSKRKDIKSILIKKHSLEKEMKKIIHSEINSENCKKLINRIKKDLKGKSLTGIIGGPPCQAYSNIGRARDKNNMENDQRNHLYQFYLSFLEELTPDFFVFENVPGLLTAGGGKYLNLMIDGMQQLGYQVEKPKKNSVINMDEYGVPQKRKRIILLGVRKGINIERNEIFKKIKPSHKNVNEIIDDLPVLQAGEEVLYKEHEKKSLLLEKMGILDFDVIVDHITRPNNDQDLEIYKIAVEKYHRGESLKYNELPSHLITHKNTTSFLDKFKVIEGRNLSCHTVVAHISKDGHHYIHPDLKQNRSLSVREAARLQTFPDSFKFEGPRTAQFKQIGNAVPPMFSEILAKRLKKYFK